MQNQANTKYFSNPEDIFKSAKILLEKFNISKFLRLPLKLTYLNF